MKTLSKIVTYGTPGSGLQFRATTYGGAGIEEFLRDVLAMANASVDGHRYIVTGVGEDSVGRRQLRDIPDSDFTRSPSYQRLVADHIEPAVSLRYYPADVHGKQVGIFEIGDCADKPYMMRVDYSETLRRGDAWARSNTQAVKLGRRQLQAMFEQQFRESVSSDQIEIGFAGDHIAKARSLRTFDMSALPSQVASTRLREILAARDTARQRGATSMVARLTHARVYGSDSPYEYRSPDELRDELARIADEYVDQDASYLFEEHGDSLQMVVYNQGEESLRDATLTVVLPAHNEFLVAEQLPKHYRDNTFVERSAVEQSSYPTVSISDGVIQVTSSLGQVPAGELIESFAQPLRVCAGTGLRGKRIGIQYVLSASNLKRPAKGKLRLVL